MHHSNPVFPPAFAEFVQPDGLLYDFKFAPEAIQNSNWENITFELVEFPKVKFSGATFKKCYFQNCEDFKDADLKGATFTNCEFNYGDVQQAKNWRQATFKDCTFFNCLLPAGMKESMTGQDGNKFEYGLESPLPAVTSPAQTAGHSPDAPGQNGGHRSRLTTAYLNKFGEPAPEAAPPSPPRIRPDLNRLKLVKEGPQPPSDRGGANSDNTRSR
jgi:uncharacterized protein YjbI with pentapeptide repeats